MADRFYGYQYDTNPRKLNSEYAQYRKRYPQNKEPVTTNRSRSKNTKKDTVGAAYKNSNRTTRVQRSDVYKREVPEYGRKQVDYKKNNVQTGSRLGVNNTIQNDAQSIKMKKAYFKAKLKIVVFLFAGFSVLFAISYQNSLISESFNKKEQYKKEMEALKKTNQQIEVSIENNLNLNHIEQAAKDRLGMQKLDNNQKIYVSLPKVDYVAPASEQIVMEEDLNFFEKLFNKLWK